MAVGQADNRWWLDVLEHGRGQRLTPQLFDIDWTSRRSCPEGQGARPLSSARPMQEALAAGDLQLRRDPSRRVELSPSGLMMPICFPIRPEDQHALEGEAELRTQPGSILADDAEGRAAPARPCSNASPTAWRGGSTAGDEINWRRFFDIIELAARPKVERARGVRPDPCPAARASTAEGLIDGVRVDHVDGLADPAAYCRRLRAALDLAESHRPADAAPGPAYFVVEKILAQGERLSPDWRTDGTTGYDYMNDAAALLHDREGEAALTDLWVRVSGRSGAFEDEERRARLETVERSFAGQREACVRAFHGVARSDLSTRDLTAGMIRRALNTLLSVFPAYRSYGTGVSAPASDTGLLAVAIGRARAYAAPGETPVLERIAAWLRGEGPGDPDLRAVAVRRFQQLSAPVAAKAVEDTAFYRYGRLLSRDDVGSDPARLAMSVDDMHAANASRAADFPHAMLTTATHDHKRGEDVRARLAVLSERPQSWADAVMRWDTLNRPIAADVDPLDLYPLYQTLVGAWPLDLSPDDVAGLDHFRERVARWWRKALREAKLNSSWAAPDEAYEGVCDSFLAAALGSEAFLDDLAGFAQEIAPAGAVNGLSQALLRCTAPGVPDLYQGAEGWDLSLVDPDNRRPVDYGRRQADLADAAEFDDLLATWRDGRVKQRVIASALDLRRRWPEVFRDGDYTPLEVEGARSGHVIAFLRRAEGRCVLVAAALNVDGQVSPDDLGLAAPILEAVGVVLPKALTGSAAINVLTNRPLSLTHTLVGSELFARAPGALLAIP